jgi:hypothetical protein
MSPGGSTIRDRHARTVEVNSMPRSCCAWLLSQARSKCVRGGSERLKECRGDEKTSSSCTEVRIREDMSIRRDEVR